MSKVTHWTHLPTPVQPSRSPGMPPPAPGVKAGSHGRGASVLLVRGACGQEDTAKALSSCCLWVFTSGFFLGTDRKCDPGPCLPGSPG